MHWLQAVGYFCSLVDDGGRNITRNPIETERAKWIAALGDGLVVPLVIRLMQAIKFAAEEGD